ncbi:PEP-CTERM sorting domain-containing protein [Undibacterium terreum]|uniref:PEP-CTERM protein-sorting domain-containing protein n=1 Tax=Undibacterium terreum TaxID=1224302 RepID=A0A916U6L7_9BURK|nr:PEP-CTERM sorting domain-containing protein [Undibacterium terreum]GGC62665.1 hypothetical protein GCM10011396_07040 [Undibacterium terreum]
MKVLQLMRDVLLGLIALLVMMALMTRPASATAEYRPLTSATALSSRVPTSTTDKLMRASATKELTAADGDNYLTQLTADHHAAGNHRATVQAVQHVSGGCNSLTSPMHCDSIQTSTPSGSETGFLPEPSPWFMLILGLLGIVLLRREP